MDKKKGIIVLLIAAVAILYFGGYLGGDNTCPVETEDHVCTTDAEHACVKHECTAATCDDYKNDKKDETQILESPKKESLFYAKAEQFEYLKNSYPLSITKIVFSSIMPANQDYLIICTEVLKFIGEEKIVFNAHISEIEEEDFEEYMTKQKGEITIGDNKYSANLYSKGKDLDENHASFTGEIVFSIPSIKSLNGESFSIAIKGKK